MILEWSGPLVTLIDGTLTDFELPSKLHITPMLHRKLETLSSRGKPEQIRFLAISSTHDLANSQSPTSSIHHQFKMQKKIYLPLTVAFNFYNAWVRKNTALARLYEKLIGIKEDELLTEEDHLSEQDTASLNSTINTADSIPPHILKPPRNMHRGFQPSSNITPVTIPDSPHYDIISPLSPHPTRRNLEIEFATASVTGGNNITLPPRHDTPRPKTRTRYNKPINLGRDHNLPSTLDDDERLFTIPPDTTRPLLQHTTSNNAN